MVCVVGYGVVCVVWYMVEYGVVYGRVGCGI